MTRNVPALLLAHLRSRVTTCCFCWKLERTDGLIMGFTDHDVDVVFDGVTYQAATSFSASAIEDQLGLAVSNVDVVGALVSDAITNDDLEAGRYDECALTIYLVNWLDPENQNCVMRTGTVGQVQIGDLAFQAELRGLMQAFAQYLGSLCGPKCRVANLGATGSGLEGGCNFVMPAPESGVIAVATNRATFDVTVAGSFPDGTKGSLSGGYFAFGFAKITNPASKNYNLSREIYASSEITGGVTIALLLPFPFDLNTGDTIELQIGCDKTSEVCRINFDNLINFRGEPYVPGTDQVFKVNGE